MRELIVDETKYTDTWYKRHRKFEETCFLYQDNHLGDSGSAPVTRLDAVRHSQQHIIDHRPRLWDIHSTDVINDSEENECSLFSGLGMFSED